MPLTKLELIEQVLQRLDDKSFALEPKSLRLVSNGMERHRIIELRRVNNLQEGISVHILLGFEIEEHARLYAKSTKSSYQIAKFPTHLGRLSHYLEGTDKQCAIRYGCHPKAEWWFRSPREYERKVIGISSALNENMDKYFCEIYEDDFVQNIDEFQVNENRHIFLKKIIDFYLRGDIVKFKAAMSKLQESMQLTGEGNPKMYENFYQYFQDKL